MPGDVCPLPHASPSISHLLSSTPNADQTSHSASSFPPTLLATLIAAQYLRPPQFLPLLFPPVLLGTTYVNLRGYPVDAAGASAAWSALYAVLAARRKQPLLRRWGVRGVVRGATMGLALANAAAGGWVYLWGKRKKEVEEVGASL